MRIKKFNDSNVSPIMIELSPLPEQPLVSIIIPSYNQARFIGETIHSILSQSYRPLEILVVDGASKDETIDVLKSYNATELHWWSEPDSGPVEAVNKGFTKAKGEICSIQSSDDFYLPGAIQNVVTTLCLDRNIGLVYGDYIKVDAEGKELDRFRPNSYSLSGLLARETFIPQSTAFFRMDLIKHLGGWDNRIPYVPDTDLWFRIAFNTHIKKIDAFLSCSRLHPDQRDVQKESIYRDYKRMLNQSVEIKIAPWQFKIAAKVGFYMLGLRYNIYKSDWELTKTLWKAVTLRPRLLFSKNLPKHRLIPGYFKFTQIFGKIRCFLKSQRSNK